MLAMGHNLPDYRLVPKVKLFQSILHMKYRERQTKAVLSAALVSVLCLTSCWPMLVHAQTYICPEFDGGGYDYTNPQHRKKHLAIVEEYHFSESVRSLRQGMTGRLIGDIEYTLNFFPNHHEALDTLARLALREGKTKPDRAEVDIECRFKWAEKKQPRDPLVPAIRGIYYYRADRLPEAKQYLGKALRMAPDNAEINYNLGLTLFALGEFESARKRARKAYQLGYPLPGLRNKLKEEGYSL